MKHELDIQRAWVEQPFCFEHHRDGDGNLVPLSSCTDCGTPTLAHMRVRGEGWIRLCQTCMEPYMLEWIVPQ